MVAPFNLPDFIDNEDFTLAQALDGLLRAQSQADIASGYFNLGGFALVKEALQSVPRLRLLLSKEQGASGGELYPAGFRQDLASMELNEENRELARELVRFLRRPEVEVRLYTRGFFHGKAYIFDHVAIIGSSNFTRAGLTANTELNSVHKQVYAAQEARRWFERFWNLSEDYKLQLIELLEESKLISNRYPPFLVFLKSLYEYFKDELTLDLEQGRDLGKSLVDLADFQEKAFERALRVLEKYDGVFIADSVGLGKTWIGKKLLEHFGYFQRKRCLVIAPAQLVPMWQEELQAIQVAAEVVSMESMGRRADFNWERYLDADVVLVDESHNFRNYNNRYEALSRIMGSGKRKKAIFLTATPINNSLFDLYNQILLFTRGEESYFAQAGIPNVRNYFVQALKDGDLLNLLEEIMIRRTRQFIKQEFPNAVIDGEPVRFPERRLHTERYDLEALYPGLYREIAQGFEAMGFAVYNPEAYLLRPGEEERREEERNQALIALIKTQLLKRFESSVEAFRISLERHIRFHERFLEELDQGRLLSGKEYQKLLALGDEEEAVDLLQTLPRVQASTYEVDRLRRDVQKDLGRLRNMWGILQRFTVGNDPKVAQLVELIQAKRGKKLVVFSYFKDTILYLRKALLEDWAGALGGLRWAVIHGDTPPRERAEILKRFAPRSQKVEVPPEEEIDLLLSTDVLSEGQNLQDADTLVNFDLHWNPTRMIQRAGRIDRLGSPFAVVHIHNFFPEQGLEEMLGLLERLYKKIEQIDRNVGLDASVLGEVVHPRTFNALRRIEAEDEKVADELEAELEFSGEFTSEFMRLLLSTYLQKFGMEYLEAIPYGVHSGIGGKGRRGVFFHFKVRGEHIWRFYDLDQDTILDSKQKIYALIRCEEDTPRVEADYDVDFILKRVKNKLLEDLNVQRAAVIEKRPKPQREVLEALRALARHPEVDRDELLGVLKALNQPLSPILVRDLEKTYKEHKGKPGDLVRNLTNFVNRYRLTPKGGVSEGGEAFREEDLELVVYMTLA